MGPVLPIVIVKVFSSDDCRLTIYPYPPSEAAVVAAAADDEETAAAAEIGMKPDQIALELRGWQGALKLD